MFAVIGEVTNTGNMELFWHGEKCAEVPVQPVSDKLQFLIDLQKTSLFRWN